MRALLATIALFLPTLLAAQDMPEGNTASCTAPEGWSEITASDSDFVVFGELHGTNEAPAFISRLLCAEAMRGQRLLLAVEHSSWQNPAWQEAWALSHDAFEKALPPLGWQGRNDGVASEAMFRLVLAAHSLRDRGAPIDIVAFNGARDAAQHARFAELPGQGPHEASQAENIAKAAARKDYDRVIVLVGSLHAEIAPITLSVGGPEFEPMAMRLATYGSVLSLEAQHAGGSSWNCTLPPDTKLAAGQEVTSDMIECASHSASADMKIERPPYIALRQFPNARLRAFYDGFYWLGPITASPPAFPGPN